ncbi:MAG: LytTR family DNA-binding domain-containing protein [Anaerovibrio sp.]|uniref:LytR/AlgR family response regulator transcription factor n=1 Tax=Anaerovibrio sp. TaxID=1872532 RepID=UPI002E75E698|nr:LytTR family DNA-binding domain-containing protein [Anaerovibrio sp.]MEE1306657.1 LytTR family DNA-binding domain-containing protein [Anaerovibrio sp.]
MLRVAIVEDDIAQAQKLADYVKQYAHEKKIMLETSHYADSLSFLEAYSGQFDIVFLDISMPVMDGMECAGHLREHDENVMIVFVTNMAHMAIKGYAVKAYDFILKPVNYLIVKRLLIQAEKAAQRRAGKYINLQTQRGLIRISIDEILYAEVADHNLTLVLQDSTHTLRGTMTYLESELKPLGFARCHNCYLVNLKYVERLDKGLCVVGGHCLAVSRPRQKSFMMELTRYVTGGRA